MNFSKKKQNGSDGHKIDQNGIRPLPDKLEAITILETSKNEKELKSFLGRYNISQSISKTCQHKQIY